MMDILFPRYTIELDFMEVLLLGSCILNLPHKQRTCMGLTFLICQTLLRFEEQQLLQLEASVKA